MVDEPLSELEDEDADFYYGSNADEFLPLSADLPWIGEAPQRPPPSDQPTVDAPIAYGNDRMVVWSI